MLCIVAPFVGVRIEISLNTRDLKKSFVTLFMGVWIEIYHINAKVTKIYFECNSYPISCTQYIY